MCYPLQPEYNLVLCLAEMPLQTGVVDYTVVCLSLLGLLEA